MQITSVGELKDVNLKFPIIVKPVDRSGSRGITKLDSANGLDDAVNRAIEQGFEKCALIEEFATGQEYSVEFISWKGEHRFLAMTKKYTTGEPYFIETGHMEPAPIDKDMLERVEQVVSHALTSLGVQYGASHSELKISADGDIEIIEIGARMGGDNIGAALVQLSTGNDFVGAVLDVALGYEPKYKKTISRAAGIRFIFEEADIRVLEKIKREHMEYLVEEDVHEITAAKITDSGSRFGYYMFAADEIACLEPYMPQSRI